MHKCLQGITVVRIRHYPCRLRSQEKRVKLTGPKCTGRFNEALRCSRETVWVSSEVATEASVTVE